MPQTLPVEMEVQIDVTGLYYGVPSWRDSRTMNGGGQSLNSPRLSPAKYSGITGSWYPTHDRTVLLFPRRPYSSAGANDTAPPPASGSFESGIVKLEFTPHDALAEHVVHFIELAGTVSLTMDVVDAMVDSTSDALGWTDSSQPWDHGDQLMVRIDEVTATTYSDPSVTYRACFPTFPSPLYGFMVSEDMSTANSLA